MEKKYITFKYHKIIIQKIPDLFFHLSFNYPNKFLKQIHFLKRNKQDGMVY